MSGPIRRSFRFEPQYINGSGRRRRKHEWTPNAGDESYAWYQNFNNGNQNNNHKNNKLRARAVRRSPSCVMPC
jgi:hypothetical protein